jgi:hypothetical protein
MYEGWDKKHDLFLGVPARDKCFSKWGKITKVDD